MSATEPICLSDSDDDQQQHTTRNVTGRDMANGAPVVISLISDDEGEEDPEGSASQATQPMSLETDSPRTMSSEEADSSRAPPCKKAKVEKEKEPDSSPTCPLCNAETDKLAVHEVMHKTQPLFSLR